MSQRSEEWWVDGIDYAQEWWKKNQNDVLLTADEWDVEQALPCTHVDCIYFRNPWHGRWKGR